MAIDLNQIAQSFYGYFNYLNNTAAQTVGIDVHWMRSVPHNQGTNTSDVIFHEYTLYDVECPKKLRAVATNSGYNPGNFSIDLFGINYEQPFELNIDTSTWTAAYGTDIMPQKNDIVYVDLLNLLYEVQTSTIIYGFAERETGFKVQLVKYNPRANRRESEQISNTIDDLTVSEQELFGDTISKEVSDLVDNEQTSQLLNTYKEDPYKECDIDSIMMSDIYSNSNLVSVSYYNMSKISRSIVYNFGDSINQKDKDYNRFFSCWFKAISKSPNIFNVIDAKEGHKKTVLYIDTDTDFKQNEQVVLTRGTFVYIHAAVIGKRVDGYYIMACDSAEYQKAKQRLTDFWSTGLKVTKSSVMPLIMGRTNDKCVFNISLIGQKQVYIKFNDKIKVINLDSNIEYDKWYGIGINIGVQTDVMLWGLNSSNEYKLLERKEVGSMENDFSIGAFYINESPICLTNLRLYKTGYQVSTSMFEKDINSRLVLNDSNAVLNDSAAVPNKSPYISRHK